MAETLAQAEPSAPIVQIRLPVELVRHLVVSRWYWILLLVALLGLLVYISADERFYVYSARVAGARHIEPAAIYEAAGMHEQNIFWIRPKQVEQSIQQLPGVRAAHVRAALPARVTITVDEREPVILWRATAQGRDWWVDQQGVVLPYHGDPNAESTVWVVDYTERKLEVGEQIKPLELVGSVRALAAGLPGIRAFSYHADRGLSFLDSIGGKNCPVYVGTSDNLAEKIRAVRVLTDYLETRGIRPGFLDVRWPERPAFGR